MDVKSPEFGSIPTVGIAAIVESEGFGRRTKLEFGPPTDASFRKAHKDFDGKNYWEAMGVTPYIALTLNRDDVGDPRSYLGVFRVSGFKLEKDVAIGERTKASITIHEIVAAHDRDAPMTE